MWQDTLSMIHTQKDKLGYVEGFSGKYKIENFCLLLKISQQDLTLLLEMLSQIILLSNLEYTIGPTSRKTF